ncbi:hypothetical protein EGW08_003943 [Elysia chlorotica]|uniref:Ig-like domain-containing protein n=1 Tax=Elysia chlorotica TaxID=188477 RepID=A0A433U3B9_ELYCH|nr:hypothetical protein EGW08_003943 [Elysia chlorotica]
MVDQAAGFAPTSVKLWILNVLIIGLLAVVPGPSHAQWSDAGIVITGATNISDETPAPVTVSIRDMTPPDDEAELLPVNDPPQIYSHIERVIKVGQNVSIGCEGARDVVWEYTEKSGTEGMVYTGQTKYSPTSKLFNREIHIVNANWNFTGFYRCRYKDLSKWVTTTTTAASVVQSEYAFIGSFSNSGPDLSNPLMSDTRSAQDKLNNVQEGDGVWAAKFFLFVSDPKNPFQYEKSSFSFVTYFSPFFFNCGVTDPSFRVRYGEFDYCL